jgi:hypothetical protein
MVGWQRRKKLCANCCIHGGTNDGLGARFGGGDPADAYGGSKISDVRSQCSIRFHVERQPSSAVSLSIRPPSKTKRATMVRRRYVCCGILSAIGGASSRPFGLVSSVKRSLMVRRIEESGGRRGVDDGLTAAFHVTTTGDRPIASIPRGGSASSSSPSSTTYDEEEAEEGDDEEEDEEEGEDAAAEDEEEEEGEDESKEDVTTQPAAVKSATPAEPVVLTIQTSSGSAVLDQSIELENVTPSRTIASIKSSISKKLSSKPPPSIIALRFDGRLLADEELVRDIVKEAKEEEEAEEEHDEAEDADQSAAGLVFTMDTIVPVDPKFVPDLERKFPDLTSEELLQAYAANEAALYQNSLILEQVPIIKNLSSEDEDADDQDEDDDVAVPQSDHLVSVNAVIRERIARIRADLDTTVLATENAKTLLADALSPNAKIKQQPKVEIKGQRIRRPEKSIALRGVVQRNLNINWFYTGRAMFALLFCGFFGGKSAVSKSIMLLGAPLIVILQLRPVKAALTQFIYALLLHPPSIILSLLPVPQQVMLSMDVDAAMLAIYGDQLKEKPRQRRMTQPALVADDVGDDLDEEESEESLGTVEDDETEDDEEEDDADDDDPGDKSDSDESYD